MSSSSAAAERSSRSKGRQKIEMKKMTNESNLQVTFSKRRTGLFKKASELCTLCGADVALIVFSPGDKAFSFGHPNAEAVIDRFLSGGMPQPPSASMQVYEAHRNANVRDLNAQLTRLTEQLEAEKKRSEELNHRRKEMEARCWWAAPLDTMSRDQLATMKASLEELKKKLLRVANRTLVEIASKSNANNNPSPQLYVGSSSSRPVLPPLQLPPRQVAAPSVEMFPPPPLPPPQPLMIQNPMFDGNVMPLPAPHGFQSFHNNMGLGGYGGQGYY